MATRLISVLLMIALGGCFSRFQETHYFKLTESTNSNAPINYFRLKVSGNTLFASARYVSGYFDEEAVNMYFNEFSQPSKAMLFGESTKTFSDVPPTTRPSITTKPLDKNLEGKSLVLILSSNSDEIATQIGTLAENERTVRAIGRLVNRDRLLAARGATEALRTQKLEGKKLVDLGDTQISRLDTNHISQSDAQTRILAYVNALGASLGYEGRFQTLKQASEWLAFHRGQLMKE